MRKRLHLACRCLLYLRHGTNTLKNILQTVMLSGQAYTQISGLLPQVVSCLMIVRMKFIADVFCPRGSESSRVTSSIGHGYIKLTLTLKKEEALFLSGATRLLSRSVLLIFVFSENHLTNSQRTLTLIL